MFLLDTNVVSELRKIRAGTADQHVSNWARSVNSAVLFISAITIQELEFGILRMERRDPFQGARLRQWLETAVFTAFDGRILPVDTAVARRAAQFHVPDPQPLLDALIAATAAVHGMTVVTRNLADFTGRGVALLNPWDTH